MQFSVLRNRDGSLREVQAAARDISERKGAASARRVADEQFRTAFDDAPTGMALVAPDGEWLRVNPALCDIVGYSREELLARRSRTSRTPTTSTPTWGCCSRS